MQQSFSSPKSSPPVTFHLFDFPQQIADFGIFHGHMTFFN